MWCGTGGSCGRWEGGTSQLTWGPGGGSHPSCNTPNKEQVCLSYLAGYRELRHRHILGTGTALTQEPSCLGKIFHYRGGSSAFICISSLASQGVGLCHGISGSAFVFLACHRAASHAAALAASAAPGSAATTAAALSSAADQQLRRAWRFALFAARNWEGLLPVPDRPLSLYEGLCGAIVLWGQLCAPHQQPAGGSGGGGGGAAVARPWEGLLGVEL